MKLALSLLLASSFWMGNAIAEESNVEAALEMDQLNEQSFAEEQTNPNPLSFDFNALDESILRDHGRGNGRGNGNGRGDGRGNGRGDGRHNGGGGNGHHNGGGNGGWNGGNGHHNGGGNGHHNGRGGWNGNGRWRPIPRLATTCFAKNIRSGLTFRVRGFGPSWDLQDQAVRFCKRNSARPNACRPIGCRR